jgi:phosphoribosylamine--glycine ligase
MVFHAGTRREDARLLTSGGRVVCVTALGENLRTARRRAYEAAALVRFDGAQYRKDIGARALPVAT